MRIARAHEKGATSVMSSARGNRKSGLSEEPLRSVDPGRLRKSRILVVGDVMLDRYWFGEVGRISPEAPVPVVKIDRVEERPGGAANVARNAAALGAQVSLLSVVGRDEAGTTLRKLLRSERITAQLHTDAGVPTTIKLRVIGRQQQLVRVDFEMPPSHEALASKLRDFQRLLSSMDAVILSDYGKGGLTHIVNMIRMARQAGKPVLIDPKGDDYSRYRGASLITPNRAELQDVVGRWSSAERGRAGADVPRGGAHAQSERAPAPAASQRASAHPQRGGHDTVWVRWAAACTGTGARSLRREWRRRHRDSDHGCDAGQRRAAFQPRRPRHRPS